MEPSVQLDPDRCILVLGPQIAAECLPAPAMPPPALSYNMLLEAGVQKMLELEDSLSTEEKIRKRTLLVNAYELDPAFVGNIVVNSLKKYGKYDEWLSESFSTISSLQTKPSHTTNLLIDKLQSLVRMGSLLVYTYYDMIVDHALGTQPILMENEEDVRNWATRKTPGVLHVHGVHSEPASVCCDCVNYQRIIGGSKSGRCLREICKSKTVIFVGFDGEFFDPFMPKFSTTFVDTSFSQGPPLLVSCMPKISHSISFLTLRIAQMSNLSSLLIPSSRQGVSRETLDSNKHPLSTTLLYADKRTCLEAAEKVKTISSIKVHQLTMRHEMSHELVLYLDREGLKNLWQIVSSPAEHRSRDLHAGLLGIKMSSNFTVWLDVPSSVKTADRIDQYTTPPISYHPSLSTSVSVISSIYTPIASPSISLSPKHLSSPARRTLPSPLITTTSRTPMGLLKPGQVVSSELHKHGGFRSHTGHSHNHSSQLRKIHSAHYDLGRDSRESMKNRPLVHHESSPDFYHGSECAVAYKPPYPPPALLVPTKPNAATQPSPLLQDGTNMELRIEYVDQLRESTPMAAKSNLQKKDSRESLSGSKVTNGGTAKNERVHDFIEEKQKFIHDAKQWSKKMGSNIANIVASPMFLPTIQGGAQSLSTDISPEEQEKILQQHFEQVQRSQSQLKPSTAVITPTRSPTLLSPNRSPKLPVRSSPAPTSLRLPAMTSKIPFLHNQLSTSSMFPFLGGSPVPGTSGPITSPLPLPHYAGSGLNPFQALIHYLSQHGSKPMIVTDPSLLQGLQGTLPETVPCLLPDGSVTLISMNQTLQRDHEDQRASNNTSPPRIQAGKRGRGHTPKMDTIITLPKRRRSNSLPDVSQLGNKPLEKCHQDSIPEGDDDSKPAPAHVLKAPANLFPSHLKTRDLPPSMIHIPQDIKISDVVLGIPTPQSSPSFTGLSLSPSVTMSSFQHPPPLTSVTSAFQHPQPLTPITPDHDALSNDELKEIVQAEENHTQLMPSPEDTSLPPFPQGRGPIQLWQFLLNLLLSPDKQHMIQWTGTGYEFRIILPEEIAKLWGARKNKPRMNYDKLSRGLRYYYSKGIMDKVPGKKLTFKYTCDVQQFIHKKCLQGSMSPMYVPTPLMTPTSARTPLSARTELREPLLTPISARTELTEPLLTPISARTEVREPLLTPISARTEVREPLLTPISARTELRELATSPGTAINNNTTYSEVSVFKTEVSQPKTAAMQSPQPFPQDFPTKSLLFNNSPLMLCGTNSVGASVGMIIPKRDGSRSPVQLNRSPVGPSFAHVKLTTATNKL